jgi:hypothetical protein|tara:strand:+ start:310 stop:705 length:396 start_codon:yes stop_codon:yes gene_type:complete
MDLETDTNKDGPIMSKEWLTFIFEYKGNQIIVRNGTFKPIGEIWVNDNLLHTEENWNAVMDQTITIPSGEEINIRYGYKKFGAIFMTARHGSSIIYDYVSSRDLRMWFIAAPFLLAGGIAGWYLARYILGF